jgi:hypothetical protein
MVHNHERLLEYVRVGTLEVYDPFEKRLSYEELLGLIESAGKYITDGKFELAESSLKFDLVDGASDYNTAPRLDDDEDDEEDEFDENSNLPPPPEVQTDLPPPDENQESPEGDPEGQSEETQEDQTEGESEQGGEESPEGEETPGDEPVDPTGKEDTVLDEETMLKLNRNDLNELAKSEGVENPESLPNKPAVVQSVLTKRGEG